MKTTCWIFAASLILSSGCHSSGDAVAERPDQSKKERFYSDAELQQMVERLYVKEDPRGRTSSRCAAPDPGRSRF